MQYLRNKKTLIPIALGFLLGFLLLFALHFIRAESHGVHYHANFALYINGERSEFDNFSYYEEIQACLPANGVRPESRVHMHDFVNHVVHVHDDGATWGHFFANLGYTLGNNTIITRDGVFVDGEDGSLTFLLNGQPTLSVANQSIKDSDVLLINYGNETTDELQQRYENIPTDAPTYNEKHDPSACAGEQELTISERIRRALTLPE